VLKTYLTLEQINALNLYEITDNKQFLSEHIVDENSSFSIETFNLLKIEDVSLQYELSRKPGLWGIKNLRLGIIICLPKLLFEPKILNKSIIVWEGDGWKKEDGDYKPINVRCGVIDFYGKNIIPAIYDDVEILYDFSIMDELYKCKKDGLIEYRDSSNRIINEKEFEDFEELVKNNKEISIIDEQIILLLHNDENKKISCIDGKLIMYIYKNNIDDKKYKYLGMLIDETWVVFNVEDYDIDYKYIKAPDWFLECKNEEENVDVKEEVNGYYVSCKNNLYGVVNILGKGVIPFEFDSIEVISDTDRIECYFMCEKNSFVELRDDSNNVIIKNGVFNKFESVIRENRLIAEYSDINYKDTSEIDEKIASAELKYDEVNPYKNIMTIIDLTNSKELVERGKYYVITSVDDNLYFAFRISDGHSVLLNKTGNEIADGIGGMQFWYVFENFYMYDEYDYLAAYDDDNGNDSNVLFSVSDEGITKFRFLTEEENEELADDEY